MSRTSNQLSDEQHHDSVSPETDRFTVATNFPDGCFTDFPSGNHEEKKGTTKNRAKLIVIF